MENPVQSHTAITSLSLASTFEFAAAVGCSVCHDDGNDDDHHGCLVPSYDSFDL